jgi:hypothetical protein
MAFNHMKRKDDTIYYAIDYRYPRARRIGDSSGDCRCGKGCSVNPG